MFKTLVCVSLIALAACARGQQPEASGAEPAGQPVVVAPDSMAPAVVSAAELRPAPETVPVAEQPTSAARPKRVATRPAQVTAKTDQPLQPDTPAPPPPPAVQAGTRVVTTSTQEITSRRNKAGETFTAKVAEAVTDALGREVIPAGAAVTFSIVAIKEAENKDASGILVIRPVSVMIAAQAYDIKADVTELQVEKKGRGVTTGDAAKVGAGAAAGAILGQILTKSSGGTVVGGVVGGAVGTAIAVKSADKDLVIPVGAKIVLTLSEEFVRRD
jgi:hypothetical protein